MEIYIYTFCDTMRNIMEILEFDIRNAIPVELCVPLLRVENSKATLYSKNCNCSANCSKKKKSNP